MITVSHQKEGLSIGYVTATAAAARINLAISRQHDYGVDGTFLAMAQRLQGIGEDGKEKYRYVESGTKLDFQLKCTSNWEHRGDNVAWTIKAQTYNDLVSRPIYATPLILVLLCLPKEEADWLSATEQQMVLRNCCYYAEISGQPLANENSTKVIELPRANVLTPEAVCRLLDEIDAKLAGMFS